MNKIAQMSCNPAVGGIAKGQIVREIDALGGEMGHITDATAIQFRMLNRSKGPAMWSPRAQCDREKYILEWRTTLDQIPLLDILQDQAEELLVKDSKVLGIKTLWGIEIHAKAIVVTAGTFLNGLMHIGHKMVEGGRIAEPAVHHFSESIARHGIRVARMKTGTPVRIDKRSVHFEEMEEQLGENDYHQFPTSGNNAPFHNFLAGPAPPTQRCTRYCGRVWLTLLYIMDRSTVSAHAIVPPLRPSSSHFLAATLTPSF